MNGPTRRKVIQGTGAAIVGLSITGGEAVAKPKNKPAAKEDAPQVPRRVLGKTKQKVPILLVGMSMKLDPRFDPKLAEAMRYGVNYFDGARVYGGGTCEAAIAAYHTKAKNRDKLWITTKSPEHDPKGFASDIDSSLKDLKTDFIDLYYLHALQKADYLSADLEKTVAAAKKAGKIRFFGFSCHHGNVAELLHKAAETPWVDSVMFRYNFRSYGDKELNKAIDAAAKAGVGLIAMKTQGSASSFEDRWKKLEKGGTWNKHQAVLKAVWADDRITAAVSHMDTLDKVTENVSAALDKKLTSIERLQLRRYAAATREFACDGCDHICGPHVDAPVRIGETLRYLMYHDSYGQQEEARELFAKLPAAARDLTAVDFRKAQAACPHGVQLVKLMRRAADALS